LFGHPELNLWYLDDGTLAGDPETVLEDFRHIIDFCKNLGLEVNSSKCELFFCSSFDQSVFDKFNVVCPGIQTISSELVLLGSPLTESSVEYAMNKKFDELQTMFDRLPDLNHHIAYFLLKHCFAIPKLTFLLRTAPIWKFPEIVYKFDNLIRSTLRKILNCNFDDNKWVLASLPITNGGIGIRRVQDICIPSFLSSVVGVSDLICALTPISQIDLSEISYYGETLAEWNSICPNASPPTDPSSQQQWDSVNINRITSQLRFITQADVARYAASLHKESGAWLTVLITTLMTPSNVHSTPVNFLFRILATLRKQLIGVVIPAKLYSFLFFSFLQFSLF